MSMYEYYVPECKYCGKRGKAKAGGRVGSNRPPTTAPNDIPGKCPSPISPGGKHVGEWKFYR